MSIEIKNMRNSTPIYAWDVIVDRRTCLGNPFVLSDEMTRNQSCDNYKDHFVNIILNDERCMKLLDRIKALYEKYGKLRLFCWCAPKRCHVETIKEYLLKE